MKYLIEILKIEKGSILALAFNNKPANDLKNSLKNDGYEIETMTFHRLGKEIIKEVDGKEIEILKDMDAKIDELYKEMLMERPDYLEALLIYFSFFLTEPVSEFDFITVEEYEKYIQETDLISLKGEYHRSYEEVLIANYLFKNNIKYEYEVKYPLPEEYKNKYSNLDKKNRYRPDFYLNDYNIYIEHFGIDKNGNVPAYWKSENGKSAKDNYWDGINWKRELHKDLKTKLIESYSYEYSDGNLISNLETKLLKENVKIEKLSNEEILDNIKINLKREYSAFQKLLKNFIKYAKDNNIDLEEVRRENSKNEYTRNSVFLKLVIPVYQEYERYLKKTNQIDFSDMIIKATEYLKKGKITKPYTHILVDEFQDISMTRFNLIKEIWEKNKGKLFCVGDDWQSIYKFAGSNVRLFLEFEKYTGYCEKSKIETTYRYPESIAVLSSKFIMKNPTQISKQIKSLKKDFMNKKAYEFIYYKDTSLRKTIKEKLNSLPKNSKVILLTRYRDDIRSLKGHELKEAKDKKIIFYSRRDLEIEWQTVHAAKGLEADYVFIINNNGGIVGFPSKIEDDPIFKMIKNGLDSEYPYDEERRLYYVALTRCKIKVFLFIDLKNKSEFIKEIEKEFRNPFYCPSCNEKLEYKLNGTTSCSTCSSEIKVDQIYTGRKCNCSKEYDMILKYSTKNERYFLGCPDYPECRNTSSIKIEELNNF